MIVEAKVTRDEADNGYFDYRWRKLDLASTSPSRPELSIRNKSQKRQKPLFITKEYGGGSNIPYTDEVR